MAEVFAPTKQCCEASTRDPAVYLAYATATNAKEHDALLSAAHWVVRCFLNRNATVEKKTASLAKIRNMNYS